MVRQKNTQRDSVFGLTMTVNLPSEMRRRLETRSRLRLAALLRRSSSGGAARRARA